MAAAGAFAGIAVGNNVTRLKAGLAAAAVAWPALESLGLALDREAVDGLAAASGPERPRLSGTLHGVACAVTIVSDFVHYAHTRVAATPVRGRPASIGVHPSPAGILGKVRSWLGQDILVGDAEFDQAFLITGDPAEAAPELLTPAIREPLIALATSRLAGFVYEADEVVVLLVGVETDPELLGIAIELACAAARWGQ